MVFPPGMSNQAKKRLISISRQYRWDEHYLFKLRPDQIIRICVPEEDHTSILQHCHQLACGGHFRAKKTTLKVLQLGFFWVLQCLQQMPKDRKHLFPKSNAIAEYSRVQTL